MWWSQIEGEIADLAKGFVGYANAVFEVIGSLGSVPGRLSCLQIDPHRSQDLADLIV